MKTLTIEHIAPYISHGLKVYSVPQNGEYFIEKVTAIGEDYMFIEGEPIHSSFWHEFKPILVPLDKLLSSQYREIGRALMTHSDDWSESHLIASGEDWIKFLNHSAYGIGSALRAITYLHSIKADVSRLIPAGLAISALELPENPYL